MEDLCTWTQRLFFSLGVLHSVVLVIHSQMDFTIFEISKNREDAKQYCIDNNFSGLAVLDTQDKMNAVLALGDFKDSEQYWVGIKQTDTVNPRETTFAWDSATASSWAAWNSGEPNNLNTEYCARIREYRRELANMVCSRQFFFVCELTYDGPTTEATTVVTTETSQPTTEATTVVTTTETSQPTTEATTVVTTTETSQPTTETSTSATIVTPTGYYPIILKDQTISNSYPDLVLFSGSTRSEIECVTLCAKESACRNIIYSKSILQCTTYSASLRDNFSSSISSVGTNIREKTLQ